MKHMKSEYRIWWYLQYHQSWNS